MGEQVEIVNLVRSSRRKRARLHVSIKNIVRQDQICENFINYSRINNIGNNVILGHDATADGN